MLKRNNNAVTKEAVMAAMSTVIEPELHRDLVSLNMVRDLKIDGGDVTFTIMLTTPACPLKGKMEADSRAALAQVPGITNVTVKWDSNVPRHQHTSDVGKNFRTTIAVASGKGGVGKSTVSVNLAISLAKTGARVGLLDADILGPNIPMMMGVDTMPPPRDRKMVPAENYGVKFISTAFLMRPDQALVWRGPMLHSAIRQLLVDVAWGELDYLIVDLPPGTGDAQLSLAQTMPLTGTVIVTQPMAVAAGDALRAIKMFEQLNVPILGVVENMSGDFFGTGAGEKLAESNDVPYFGAIPLDAQIRIGGDAGEPVTVFAETSPSAQAFADIAALIAAKVSVLTLMDRGNFVPIEMIG
ncbi:MAG: Mrp/NBP35 family ATP-binding protein [Anaerolineae bacterium]|nr:Mrp/NBP35 family ATP-binding protein [Anaerolineae bacterium]MCO5186956.1 Mrp/NBP35 family ATP-binding protein [Anaerolineae bacterium]MCO5191997.1 Mrp/NBP35 family ATP-binding protein [Anaerolineae bacterium]MCO5199077.1 Mrp/NBP35 family ATP-binding protein [Anaerolineae bacterium]MCO5206972.1 Mrp/NBP35 family ATP-binding protein [Anaerolineae bacterium]